MRGRHKTKKYMVGYDGNMKKARVSDEDEEGLF